VSETKTPAPAAPQKLITELKVSGQLMTLDTGLWCVCNAPGSPIPDAQSGLPGVRVSLPPGQASRPDVITIITFRDDGWLSGWTGAALVRVLRGPAQVMVTIHQAQGTTQEAPKLQVIKLADAAALPPVGVRPQGQPAPQQPQQPQQQRPAPAAPVAANAPAAPAAAPVAEVPADAEIVAHVQGRGDVGVTIQDTMGNPGSKQWIEGFSIAPRSPVSASDIEYQAVLGRGWLSPWAEGGQFCGSRGMSLPILGLRVRLRGEAAEHFDCVLEASFVDGTKLPPIDNGDPAQAESLAPLESFKVTITPRATAAAPAPAAGKAKPAAKAKATSKAKEPEPVKAAAPPPVKAKEVPAKKEAAPSKASAKAPAAKTPAPTTKRKK